MRFVYVFKDESGLKIKSAVFSRPLPHDWGTDALSIFSDIRRIDSPSHVIQFDPLPTITIDSYLDLVGAYDTDVIVLDAREYGLTVFSGARSTIKDRTPVIIYSIAPPGSSAEHDTVDHYMRFIGICHEYDYRATAVLDRYTYLLQHKDNT